MLEFPRQKYIAICTPSLGLVSVDWAGSLRILAWPLNTGAVSFFVIDEKGGEIAETRNQCVQQALDYDSPDREVTHIFWLDDDVMPSRLALIQLLGHDCDIASGVYFSKIDPGVPLIFPGPGCGTVPFVPDQFFETWGCGMGLCLVRTEVYRKMAHDLDLGKDKYGRPAWYRTRGGESAFIEDGVMKGGAVTEDLYFLGKAREVGFAPHVDTTVAAFGWHYDMRKRQGFPRKQYDEMKRDFKVTWETQDGPVVWQ